MIRLYGECHRPHVDTFQRLASGCTALALSLLLSACGGDGGSSNSQATPSGATTTATAASAPDLLPPLPDNAYTQAATPTTVSSTTDDTRAVTVTIGTAGGSVSATAADGSTFTLLVPPNALSTDTDITMTPIASTSGAPWSQASGVRLEPDGLQFLQFATLTIVPAIAVPLDHQVTLGALHGSELFLALPDVDSAVSRIRVLHFTDYWLANMAPDKLATQRLAIPTTAQLKLEQEVAAVLTRERQRVLMGATDDGTVVADLLQRMTPRWFEQVIKPMLHRDNGCADWAAATSAMLSVERQMQLLGYGGNSALNDILNGPTADLWGVSGSAAYVKANVPFGGSLFKAAEFACAKEASSRCTSQHQVDLAIVYLSGERQRQMLGIPADDSFSTTYLQWDARLQACYRFSIQLDSEIKASNIAAAGTVDTTVSAKLDDVLFPDGVSSLMQAALGTVTPVSGTLSNTSLNVTSPSWCGTVTRITTGDSTVSANFALQKINASGKLDKAAVTLTLGDTGEAWSLSNCGTGTVRVGPQPVWTDSFMSLHSDQSFDHPGIARGVTVPLGLVDLRVNQGATMVNKSWQRTVRDLTESTTLKVIHAPQDVTEPALP